MRIGRRVAIQQIAGAALGTTFQVRTGDLQPGLCGQSGVDGFDAFCFTDTNGRRHQIYVADGGGPPVILLHELPGLIDHDLAAAKRLAAERYTVIAPLLFGRPGGNGNGLRYFQTLCEPTDFACNEGEITSPRVDWLLQLCPHVRARWSEGKGIGAIGMCLTGAFPLALLRAPEVVAPILCQPTVPFNIWTRFGWFTDKDALGVSDEDLRHAKSGRTAPLLGIRYEDDWRCRHERFDRLVREFPDRFYRLDLRGNGHSTLGSDFCDHAFREVLSFLNQHLRTTPDPTVAPFPQQSKAGVLEPVRAQACAPSAHHS